MQDHEGKWKILIAWIHRCSKVQYFFFFHTLSYPSVLILTGPKRNKYFWAFSPPRPGSYLEELPSSWWLLNTFAKLAYGPQVPELRLPECLINHPPAGWHKASSFRSTEFLWGSRVENRTGYGPPIPGQCSCYLVSTAYTSEGLV